MSSSALYLSSFLHLLLSISTTTTTTAAAANAPSYNSHVILLNCGAGSNIRTPDTHRNWETDSPSKFTPPNILKTSYKSQASDQSSTTPQVPYMTARIFNSSFTYTFPVFAGPKFLRLYFYPSTYSDLDKTKSFFSVTAANYTLLTNFNAFLTIQAIKPQVFSLVKEFIINVNDNQRLDLTFSPSPNSYAFINGIEVASIPENFYIKGNENPITLVGQTSGFRIDNSAALETLYRLNVGGNDVVPGDDSGMFRLWVQDTDYLDGYLDGYLGFVPHVSIQINYTAETPAYSAPEVVYTTSRIMDNLTVTNPSLNISWRFKVDAGFCYLLRLYFCEIQQEVDLKNKRVFDIFINSKLAQSLVDIIELTHHRGTPVYIDYVVFVKDHQDGHMNKEDLSLQMHPNLRYEPEYANALLNGLEIFKLNQSDGNLAVPNPELIVTPQPPAAKLNDNRKSKASSLLIGVIGGVVGGIIVVSIAGFLICRRRVKRQKGSGEADDKSPSDPISYTSKSTKTNASSLPSVRCRHFSIEAIKSATANFDDNFVIGMGGFGNVYKGYMENGSITVAIKRLNPSSRQGAREFQTEIEMLSNLRHLHLVSLIGYCDDYGEMILVYDYMARGTLRSHLYRGDNPPLSWKQRLEICIGAARGLHYLHAGAKRLIIHRDVKSTNILLDEKWVAKVSDFGLSKMGPSDTSASHVSTVVKGSFGYLDPEYYRRQQLTVKSDVYSFGVVLFEVLCARPAIIPELPKQQVNLAEWARRNYREGTLDQIIDQNLKDEIAPESLKNFGEVGYSCLKDQGIDRPTMSDVVWNLEFVLQLQEAADKLDKETDAFSNDQAVHLLKEEMTTTTTNSDDVFSKSAEFVARSTSSGTSITTSVSDLFKSESVFSEIMNPDGR